MGVEGLRKGMSLVTLNCISFGRRYSIHLSGAWSRAFCVLVGPISCLQYIIAPFLAKTRDIIGPLLMYATRLGKNILP